MQAKRWIKSRLQRVMTLVDRPLFQGLFLFAVAMVLILEYTPSFFVGMLIRSLALLVSIALIVLGTGWFMLRKKGLAIASALAACITAFPMLHGSPTSTPAEPGVEDLRAVHINLFFRNRQAAEVLDLPEVQEADLLSFQEVNDRTAENLKASLAQSHPYSLAIPHPNDPYGIALFSRYPLENLKPFYVHGVESIEAELLWKGQRVKVLAMHTRAPITLGQWHTRNEQIRTLSRKVQDYEGPALVLGDFNTVPWDPVLKHLSTDAELQRSGQGFKPTWSPRIPIPLLSLDYMFHTPDWTCSGFETLYIAGSDHRGIVGSFRLESSGT